MKAIQLQTAKKVVPVIYAYTTPEIARHNGWTKIGYTEQDVEKRLKQQTHTADVQYHEEWRGNAIFDDGSGDRFTDKDFHAYLRKLGIENDKSNEWFHVDGPTSRTYFYDFRSNRGILKSLNTVSPYKLRKEQTEAVDKAIAYCLEHETGEFLWNAKPRFGKTLATYDFCCKQLEADKILIVTNRPAIANSWYSDYEKFFGPDSGYNFVSDTSSLQGKRYVLSRQQYIEKITSDDNVSAKCIEFVSLQDLKGSIYFGGKFDKLREVADIKWDVLVIDEAHEGVDTYKTDVAFDHIDRKFTLHLSGTPFKALANDKFPSDAIYNWTYADEQKAKQNWPAGDEEENPYATLPKLNLYTYQMSEIVKDELEQGVEIQGETEEYAFDLNEFFATKDGQFVHESSVNKFLDALTTQTKFPFSTNELRKELKHTFWLLDRVDSAKALAKKLSEHPVFSQYKVILAAGDGKLDDSEETAKAYDKVVSAIKQYDKTITLSVGQLTTGVTIPEWTAVLMLCNLQSPSLYMQAAFRAQNPCLFSDGTGFWRKENAYVFDFDPARTLTIFEEFANDLTADTSSGRGDAAVRKEHVRELLNFFPVIGEDEAGEMVELDAEKVLSIPRKIRSQEVVRRGFMSNYLFQNITNIFGAPQEAIDIIKALTPVDEPKNAAPIDRQQMADIPLDEDGNVTLDDDYVIGKSADVFGPKIFDVSENLKDAVAQVTVERAEDNQDDPLKTLKELFHDKAVAPVIQTAGQEYMGDLKKSEAKRLEKKLTEQGDQIIGKAYGHFQIEQARLENERQKQLEEAAEDEHAAIEEAFAQKQAEAVDVFKQQLTDSVDAFVQSASETIVETVETQKKEKEKDDIQDSIRDHLRGFSRTIPSFLMAYGSDTVTLETFDTIIPDEVFKEVTGITLADFRFLRDGGDYTDSKTNETKHFDGHLFDPVVFDDSVKEFMRLKKKLANYFDESAKEDIFDYIPPQKTNQIYTPKRVVKKMVDMLEDENPGCFDSPDKTFIDLYMKSGLYVAEIVKRLYQSEKLKAMYPDGEERLQHIFADQVYGLAPTEIIYRIATNFILGFDDKVSIPKHNLRLLDALPYAKNGTLAEKLDEVFARNN